MIAKIRRHIWWFAFKTAARFDLAVVAAWLLTVALGGRDRSRATSPGTVKLLLLSKRGLFEDAATAFEDDLRFETRYLDMVEVKPFKAIVSAFLPPEIDDFNYLSDNPDIEASKRRYREFSIRVLTYFLSRIQFDAVLTASFSYYAEREVAAAFEHLGVPFIALHKENLKTPGIYKFYEGGVPLAPRAVPWSSHPRLQRHRKKLAGGGGNRTRRPNHRDRHVSTRSHPPLACDARAISG